MGFLPPGDLCHQFLIESGHREVMCATLSLSVITNTCSESPNADGVKLCLCVLYVVMS